MSNDRVIERLRTQHLVQHLKQDHLWIFVDAADPNLYETHQQEHEIFEWDHTHGS